MKTLLFFLLAAFSINAHAQYYYKDIVSTTETNGMMQAYKNAKVNKVTLISYDENNTRNEDFTVAQVMDAATGILTTTTQNGLEEPSILISQTDASGRVIRTTDSNANAVSISEYQYRPDGKLMAVTSRSLDRKSNFNISETHEWQYEGDRPAGMRRVRNGKDTTHIQFVRDDKGNITEEISMRKGVKGEPVYYYYNDKNQLTDIVRFNNKAKRLLPEYMFEYNENGQVIQRITFPANSSNYTIWRYQYNPQGLRIKEAIYNKGKELIGKIEYNYQEKN